jgi:predicted enzyme involved in methoxymalonyl-ACP biosynthesis
MTDLVRLKPVELLQLYTQLVEELLKRGIVRSHNNPVAGVGEYLVVNALQLTRARQSTKGYTATDDQNRKYEIKSRRLTKENHSRLLSGIRECEAAHFDFLAGVLFNEDFTLYKACLITHGVVLRNARFRKHDNAHVLELDDTLWHREGVVDLTQRLRGVSGIF